MALFGTLDHLAGLLVSDSRFQPGLRYIRRLCAADSPDALRLRALADGAVEEIRLEQGSVAFDQVYTTRSRRDCFFESHRTYIDIQFIFAGEEVMDVLPIGGLAVDAPYSEKQDVIKYLDPGTGSRLHLHAGQAAIFFPEDGHMPGQYQAAPGLVRKTVVKVPVSGA
jgi:biofilm protein TabA